ncbi:MAG: SDR family oxidoreductase [Clostridiales bacterium]|nr:SDR family oxidoreductase [Clostridiales bacterium]
MLTLKERTALISGGGFGTGYVIAGKLLEAGMNVVICSSRKQKGEEARDSFPPELRERCLGLGCDVANPEEVRAALAAATEAFGGVDVIINGAGMHDRENFAIGDEKWNRLLYSNVTGTFVMIREAIPYLEKSKAPRIINMSTIEGRTGGYECGVATAAAKGGIIAITRSAARSLAKKRITVNCVAVGALEAEAKEPRGKEAEEALLAQIPLHRFGTAKEVVPAVEFLASEEASYITGAVIDVNGGLFMA